jgi:pyochelin biosynthetic protein PchC
MSMRTDSEDSWVRRFTDAPRSTVRLVCFPHAGGSAGYFRPLAQALAPRVETLAVQYPGRQDRRRERLIDSVPELTDAAFAALRRELDAPFAFFGHSLGAVVAFEVARRFEQLTPAGPLRLFASARRAPSLVRHDTVHLRDDDGLVAEMNRLGGTEQAVLDDPELRQLVLPVVRADYRAIETYTAAPGARLTCPVTVFVGDSDAVTPVADAAAWDRHTTKGADTQVFDGGHFYLDRHVQQVASAIADAL